LYTMLLTFGISPSIPKYVMYQNQPSKNIGNPLRMAHQVPRDALNESPQSIQLLLSLH
jgi:hypothetical protein